MWDVKNKRSLRTLEFVKATSGEIPRPWMVSVWSALFITHPEPTLASDCLTWNFVSMTSSTPTSSCLSWPRSCPHLPTINPYKSVPCFNWLGLTSPDLNYHLFLEQSLRHRDTASVIQLSEWVPHHCHLTMKTAKKKRPTSILMHSGVYAYTAYTRHTSTHDSSAFNAYQIVIKLIPRKERFYKFIFST